MCNSTCPWVCAGHSGSVLEESQCSDELHQFATETIFPTLFSPTLCLSFFALYRFCTFSPSSHNVGTGPRSKPDDLHPHPPPQSLDIFSLYRLVFSFINTHLIFYRNCIYYSVNVLFITSVSACQKHASISPSNANIS